MWQDIGIMLISAGFTVFLIPQVKSSFKGNHVDPWTSGLTALGLLAMGAIYATLGLWLSMGMSFITAGVWATLYMLWDRDHSWWNW
jgi:hypothetical protein